MRVAALPSSASAVRACAALLLSALLGAGAQAADRIFEWPSDKGRDDGGWSIQKFGPARSAQVRAERQGGAAPTLDAQIESADERPPQAQMRLPLPFKAGHRYRATLELSAPQPVDVDVMLRRGPVPYDPIALRTLRLDRAATTVVVEGVWPHGDVQGDLRIVWRQPGGRVSVRKTLVDDLGPAPFGARLPASFPPTLLGVHINRFGQHRTWPPGMKLIRFWDTYTTWSRLAPTEADRDSDRTEGFRRLDAMVDYARSSDPGATMLMTLGEPPRWASDRPDDASCAYGVGTCGAAADLDAWREHVRKLAKRYQGRIRHWELWNEPDNRVFYSSGRPMVDLARVAFEELKAADPANQLFSPGVTASGGLLWLHNFLESGGGRYIDGVGFHWYFGAVPEQLAGFMANVRTVMTVHGIGDKPIWNTEGAPTCRRRPGDPACVLGDLSDTEVEGVAPRAILTMWLNGVSAFAYYTAEGAGERTIPLLAAPSWQQSTRAARRLEALGVWLSGSRPLAVEQPSPGVYAVTLARDGGTAYVVWTEGADATWRVPAGLQAGKVEALGEAAVPLPAGGSLGVGPMPQLITGGR